MNIIYMCPPSYYGFPGDAQNRFHLDAINKWPDRKALISAANSAWTELYNQLVRANIEIITPRYDNRLSNLPDAVFTRDPLCLLDQGLHGVEVIPTRFRYASRRGEFEIAKSALQERGFTTHDAPNSLLEGGDIVHDPNLGIVIITYGPRTHPDSVDYIARKLNIPVIGIPLNGNCSLEAEGFHGDTVLCPLPNNYMLCFYDGLTDTGKLLVDKLYGNRVIKVDYQDFSNLAVNLIAVSNKRSHAGYKLILTDKSSYDLRSTLVNLGFTLSLIDMSVFRDGGGSVHCITNDVKYLQLDDIIGSNRLKVDMPNRPSHDFIPGAIIPQCSVVTI